jgi:hypothetical protein
MNDPNEVIVVSSANMSVDVFGRFKCISFIYRMNRAGPRMDP